MTKNNVGVNAHQDIKLPLAFLRNVSIGKKLNLDFGLLSAMILMAAGLGIYGLLYVRHHYEYALNFGVMLEHLSLQSENELLQARRREKDFMLRWRALGHREAKAKYLPKNEAALDNIRKIHGQILSILPDDGNAGTQALRVKVESLNEEVEIYRHEFNELVTLIAQHGHENDGLIGEFRTRVHAII